MGEYLAFVLWLVFSITIFLSLSTAILYCNKSERREYYVNLFSKLLGTYYDIGEADDMVCIKFGRSLLVPPAFATCIILYLILDHANDLFILIFLVVLNSALLIVYRSYETVCPPRGKIFLMRLVKIAYATSTLDREKSVIAALIKLVYVLALTIIIHMTIKAGNV